MSHRGTTAADAVLRVGSEGPHPRSTRSAATRTRYVVAGLATAAIALGLGLAVLTGSVLLIVLAVLVTSTMALAGSIGWRLAGGLALLGAMVVEGCFVRLTPYLPWRLAVSNLAMWTAVGAVATVVLLRGGTPRMTRVQAETLALALLVPVIGAAGFFAKYVASGGTWIAWAMNNDVAFRSVMTRWSLEDNGLLVGRGFNDPLINALLAAWSAGSADTKDVADTMWAIVHSGAQIWILLWFAVSFITSVIALRAAAGTRGSRLCLAVVAGALPWTWFVSGSGFELGFQNVSVAVLVIMLSWLVWMQRTVHPVASLTGLLLATLAAEMAWAPLAIVPFGWAMQGAVAGRHALRRTSWPVRAAPLSVLGLGLIYGVAVALPDARDAGLAAFGSQGAIQVFQWLPALALAVVGVTASLLFRRRLSSLHRWAIWSAATSCSVGMAVLLYERRGQPSFWGYYTVKYSWLVAVAVLLIVFCEATPRLSRVSQRWWRHGSGILLSSGLVLGAMYLMTPFWAPGSPFTPLALVHNHQRDPAAQAFFDILRVHPKSFVVGYARDPVLGRYQDDLTNLWLVQVSARSADDPLRSLAYQHLDPSAPSAVCEEALAWGPGVQVWTRDRAVASEFRQSCRADDLAVRFRGRLLIDP